MENTETQPSHSQQQVVSAHFVHKHKTTELHCSCGTVTEMPNDIFCGRIECKNCFALQQVKDPIGQQCVLDCPVCANDRTERPEAK